MILKLARYLFCVVTLVMTSPSMAATPLAQGSTQAPFIRFQIAIYYVEQPLAEPLATLRASAARQAGSLTLVDGPLPNVPGTAMASARMEYNVGKNYQPPSMAQLKHFARALSPQQMSALQKSRQALIMDFTHPAARATVGLRNAYTLAEQVARQTGGLLWDEETREIFTATSWHARRLATWTGPVPQISDHITVHTYKQGDMIRAVSLGMGKFALPDLIVDQMTSSHGSSMVSLMNIVSQALLEGAQLGKGGQLDIDLEKIKHQGMRTELLANLLPGAQKLAKLALVQGTADDGDPANRLAAISFERYPGPDVFARQAALLTTLFGFQDSIKSIRHDDALQAASEQARRKLAGIEARFVRGLPPGEYIQVKAPFVTSTGGREWMWVEISKWKGNDLEGVLKNQPFHVPSLKSGQLVKIQLDEAFDYIHRFPDGRQEGNTTGLIIERMQGKTEK